MAKQENFLLREYSNKVTRRDYTRIHTNFEMLNLIHNQLKSFERFMKMELKNIVESYFPITSPNGKYSLEFEKIWVEEPRRTEEEARYEGKNFEAPIFVELAIVNNETGERKKAKKTSKSTNDGVFFGNIPLITKKGTFVINGVEKVVIAQIVRSTGVYVLPKAQIKLNNSRKKQLKGLIAEFLPLRGTHALFMIPENKDIVQFLAKDTTGEVAKTFSATTLLKALGMSHQNIIDTFPENLYIANSLETDGYNYESIMKDQEIVQLISYVTNNESEVEKSSSIDSYLKNLALNYAKIAQKEHELKEALKNNITKENTAKHNELLEKMHHALDLLIIEKAAKDIVQQLALSTKAAEMEAIYSKKSISYQMLIWNHFLTTKKYDISDAGRYKFNRKLRISERIYQKIAAEDVRDASGKIIIAKETLIQKEHIEAYKKRRTENQATTASKKIQMTSVVNLKSKKSNPLWDYESIRVYSNSTDSAAVTDVIGVDSNNDSQTLTIADIISVISYVCGLKNDVGTYDDIDHLGNKRIKLIHELLKNQCAIGLARIEKFVKEKLAIVDGANKNVDPEETAKELSVKSIVNTKPFQQTIKEFFNSHQLTQFLDQENPLSELTNKRRISAMGPGGISRDDPNLDIRDVHYSHYGRICPIETPEGMNIGLIMSLATYAKVDERGFIVAPYRKVSKGKILDDSEIRWLTALQEEEYIIAQANTNTNKDGKILDEKVICRYRSSTGLYKPENIDYIDISPKQVISIATSAIPFLENDDANRALMGANMQRQAVPLIKPSAPFIGTGIEYRIASDSGLAVISETDGEVTYVDSHKVTVSDKSGKKYDHDLIKFRKSNQETTINQKPIVDLGEKVKENQILADGPAMQNGELALGQNMLIAFTTWSGYNYEDAIVISERLVNDDFYTSIHITEHTIRCSRTKVGDEEITRELPNISEDSKKYLDEDGIIIIGAEVKEDDILVGKITPRGQVDLSSEERLLQAIFGEKTKNVKETSLRVPHGGEGTVAAIKRFNMSNTKELEDDVIEIVKIYIAQKRKIQVGDKMAGRHGNKGVISKVVPLADMPHLEDGTPVDIVLNPQGVPSRMNLGQVLEIHLGFAARQIGKKTLLQMIQAKATAAQFTQTFGFDLPISKKVIAAVSPLVKGKEDYTIEKLMKSLPQFELEVALKMIGISLDQIGIKFSTPVFDGVSKEDLIEAMEEGGIDVSKTNGKFRLIDGRTGEYFDNPISVGVMYFLKLGHMVDDKIHSRAIGPYSKITQQPLGGKSQNGGQRFGEMEVWALEAYGAAHTLREILTIKSDDVRGRNLTYSAIIRGKKIPEPGIPESFKLLTKELQGLALKLTLADADGVEKDINNYEKSIDDDAEEENLVNTENNIREVAESNDNDDAF
jgi:DNA-directed RNA polymerase subunit beta